MKNLTVYCIVDVVSETILNVFSAISLEMAKRQYDQALQANKDKIYDVSDIVLMVPDYYEYDNPDAINLFSYSIPETFEEVKKFYVSYNDYISDYGQPISNIKED